MTLEPLQRGKHTSFNQMKVSPLQNFTGKLRYEKDRNDKSSEVVQILTLINTCPHFPVTL